MTAETMAEIDPKQVLNVVVGLGPTGLSCVKFCLKKGWPVAVTDSRENPPGAEELKTLAPQVKTAFGALSEDLIQEAGQLIISPGVSIHEPVIEEAIKQGMPCLGDIELFVREVKSPIIAITGTNAKSTVTALVGEMARSAGINVEVAGNIGVPVLDLLQKPEAELYVLELSSFQLETTFSLHAEVATILNISEDHMDRYASLEEYSAAKQRIYQNCDVAVINRADERIYPAVPVPKYVSFILGKPRANEYGILKTKGNTYLMRGKVRLIDATYMKIKGLHNIENALAALAIGEAAGFDLSAMLQTLREFSGLAHRCQFVRERNGATWYNDSKATNVGATKAALEGLKEGESNKIILIAGGIGKNADFTPLQLPVRKAVRKMILIGEAADDLVRILNKDTDVEKVGTLAEAVNLADNLSQPGDKILLSPACASFDMFKNFEHRGDEFMRLVNAL